MRESESITVLETRVRCTVGSRCSMGKNTSRTYPYRHRPRQEEKTSIDERTNGEEQSETIDLPVYENQCESLFLIRCFLETKRRKMCGWERGRKFNIRFTHHRANTMCRYIRSFVLVICTWNKGNTKMQNNLKITIIDSPFIVDWVDFLQVPKSPQQSQSPLFHSFSNVHTLPVGCFWTRLEGHRQKDRLETFVHHIHHWNRLRSSMRKTRWIVDVLKHSLICRCDTQSKQQTVTTCRSLLRCRSRRRRREGGRKRKRI